MPARARSALNVPPWSGAPSASAPDSELATSCSTAVSAPCRRRACALRAGRATLMMFSLGTAPIVARLRSAPSVSPTSICDCAWQRARVADSSDDPGSTAARRAVAVEQPTVGVPEQAVVRGPESIETAAERRVGDDLRSSFGAPQPGRSLVVSPEPRDCGRVRQHPVGVVLQELGRERHVPGRVGSAPHALRCSGRRELEGLVDVAAGQVVLDRGPEVAPFVEVSRHGEVQDLRSLRRPGVELVTEELGEELMEAVPLVARRRAARGTCWTSRARGGGRRNRRTR